MNVLILGGTGAMGTHLVRLLKKTETETFVTSRQNLKSDGNIHYLHGDARDAAFLQHVLRIREWDAIVDFMIYGTRTFGERMEWLLGGTKQYVFLSSARVYAGSEKPITETSPRLLDVSPDVDYLATDEYALSKARQEDALKNSGFGNWTVIRPYITYSERRLQLGALEKEEWLYRAMHGRTIVFSDEIGARTTTLTYGLNVAEGILSITGSRSALGEIFHITANESKTWNDILTRYLSILEKHLGYRPGVLSLTSNKFATFRPGASKYQILYDRMFDRTFDNSKIGGHVDTDHFVSPETGLKKCMEEFLKNPVFPDINWKMEAIRDVQTGERTPLREIRGVKQKIKYLIYRYCHSIKTNKS